MTNMTLWNDVCVTDPQAVKPITGKQYKGNSPKPYWLIKRATETFGPCGIGWGVQILDERFERFGDESLHVAKVRVWYEQDAKRGEIEQMGQTKAAYTSAAGKFIVDEDAPKKSVTDGMVKCLSMLGFAGDIFSGQWDDSKYVAWADQQYAEKEAKQAEKPAKVNPAAANPKQRAATITAMVEGGEVAAAAAKLAHLTKPEIDAVFPHLDNDTASALNAAWPK